MNPCARAAIAASVFATASALATPVTIEWVTVGNPRNAPDPLTGLGAVDYEYRIGMLEVTNDQYAAFLNTVAASDPNGLYNTNMESNVRGGIIRSGVDGSYTYSVKPNMGNKPVNFVSWLDAARMANWLTNGQGAGGTESGVYNFTGLFTIGSITRDLSNPDQVFIPTLDEWYKAAYHQPAALGGDSDNYWLYATRSNNLPIFATATSTGNVANPGLRVVNYGAFADWNGLRGNFTTVGSAFSTSFYGAFDMNGNVWEWNETLVQQGRGLRGGGAASTELNLRSTFENWGTELTHHNVFGIRFASPAPARCIADINENGILDLEDVNRFILGFLGQLPTADLAAPFGLWDLADVIAFSTSFNSGCP